MRWKLIKHFLQVEVEWNVDDGSNSRKYSVSIEAHLKHDSNILISAISQAFIHISDTLKTDMQEPMAQAIFYLAVMVTREILAG